ncbi:MAG: hypothetical protein HRU33_22870 [Rhodobacteraceae bacterium]|nr:hypothetical protein [Paracoccaceae bacterium]
MSAGDRRIKIDRLRALEDYDRGILTNARCLSEGVDVPSLDGVAFIDPKGSQVDIIQAVGRAIRKSENKELGTIVIPVFIEEGDDVEASIDVSNFKPVWDVLKALRAHDEVLADSLDQYRTNMAKLAYLPNAWRGSRPSALFGLPDLRLLFNYLVRILQPLTRAAFFPSNKRVRATPEAEDHPHTKTKMSAKRLSGSTS